MRLVIILFVLCLATPCFAFDDWSRQDIALQTIYSGLHIIDWGQTLDIARHPRMRETNYILGRRPSRGAINIYMGSTLVVNALVTHILPASHRVYWQTSGIVIEALMDGNNYGLKLRLNY